MLLNSELCTSKSVWWININYYCSSAELLQLCSLGGSEAAAQAAAECGSSRQLHLGCGRVCPFAEQADRVWSRVSVNLFYGFPGRWAYIPLWPRSTSDRASCFNFEFQSSWSPLCSDQVIQNPHIPVCFAHVPVPCTCCQCRDPID